jgi:opacity protein-like surface antigen
MNSHRQIFKTVIFAVVVTILFGGFSALDAQRLSVGVMGGGQGIPAVRSVDFSSVAANASLSKRLIFGPTLEWRLPFDLSLEVDVLHRQIFGHVETCVQCSANQFQIHTRKEDANGHSWEFAFLAKKYMKSMGGVRPFGTVGVSERVTTGESRIQTYDAGPFGSPTTFSATETAESKKSTAALLGLGAEVKINGRWLISPQLRYARWSNRPFSQFGFVSSRNSLDLLLSLRVGLQR